MTLYCLWPYKNNQICYLIFLQGQCICNFISQTHCHYKKSTKLSQGVFVGVREWQVRWTLVEKGKQGFACSNTLYSSQANKSWTILVLSHPNTFEVYLLNTFTQTLSQASKRNILRLKYFWSTLQHEDGPLIFVGSVLTHKGGKRRGRNFNIFFTFFVCFFTLLIAQHYCQLIPFTKTQLVFSIYPSVGVPHLL